MRNHIVLTTASGGKVSFDPEDIELAFESLEGTGIFFDRPAGRIADVEPDLIVKESLKEIAELNQGEERGYRSRGFIRRRRVNPPRKFAFMGILPGCDEPIKFEMQEVPYSDLGEESIADGSAEGVGK